jgi:hypothetical protein
MKTSELRRLLLLANQSKPPESWPEMTEAIDRLQGAGADLAAEVIKLREALAWYVLEDDTLEGDEPIEEHRNRTWRSEERRVGKRV